MNPSQPEFSTGRLKHDGLWLSRIVLGMTSRHCLVKKMAGKGNRGWATGRRVPRPQSEGQICL